MAEHILRIIREEDLPTAIVTLIIVGIGMAVTVIITHSAVPQQFTS